MGNVRFGWRGDCCNVFRILKQSVYRISCPFIGVVSGLSTANCLSCKWVKSGWDGEMIECVLNS